MSKILHRTSMKKDLIKLLKTIVGTNSASLCLTALYEFLDLNKDFFSSEERSSLLGAFKAQETKQQESGRTNISHRWKKAPTQWVLNFDNNGELKAEKEDE
jgi:hypothetical protein